MASGNKQDFSSRKKGPSSTYGCQLDILASVDTRYPDIHSKRRLPGNGKVPPNPFGKKMEKPRVGKPTK